MLQWLNDEKVKYFLVIFYFSFDGSEKICGIATPVGFVLSVPRAGRMFVISASSLLMYRHCMWCFVLEGRKIFFSQYLDILRQPLPFGTKHAWLEYTAGKIKGERKQCSRVYHETSAQKKKKKKLMSDRLDWAITVISNIYPSQRRQCCTHRPHLFCLYKKSVFFIRLSLYRRRNFLEERGGGCQSSSIALALRLQQIAKETKSVCTQDIRHRAAPKAYGLSIKVNQYFHLLVAWVTTAGPTPPSIGSALYFRPQQLESRFTIHRSMKLQKCPLLEAFQNLGFHQWTVRLFLPLYCFRVEDWTENALKRTLFSNENGRDMDARSSSTDFQKMRDHFHMIASDRRRSQQIADRKPNSVRVCTWWIQTFAISCELRSYAINSDRAIMQKPMFCESVIQSHTIIAHY